MSDIVLTWTTAALPLWLRTEAKQGLYPLIEVTGNEYQRHNTEKRLFEQLWDQANQFLVLRPSQQSEATCRHTFCLYRVF